MNIILRGHSLDQRQLDALVPVLNESMQGKHRLKKKLEEACVAALEAAGCPLGSEPAPTPAGAPE